MKPSPDALEERGERATERKMEKNKARPYRYGVAAEPNL